MAQSSNGTDPLTVLGKAFLILDAFRPEDTELTLAELSRRTGLTKPTAHRLIGQLVGWGALERTEFGVRLGMRLFELGQLVPRQRGLREAAMPFMEDLYEATHENVHLAVLDGFDVLYLEKISGNRAVSARSRVGGRLPAHCTGVGKAILAFSPPGVLARVVDGGLRRMTRRTIVAPGLLERDLAAAVRRGVAYSYEETSLGVVSVGAPIFDHRGSVIAGMSITGRSSRLDLGRVSPALRTATLSLSRQLAAGGLGTSRNLRGA